VNLNRKKDAYARFGVPSYWIVDPAGPEFTIFGLQDGKYVLEAKTVEAFTASRPFPVSIVPASLTSRLRLD
jgi:Uma2 family endonuclease